MQSQTAPAITLMANQAALPNADRFAQAVVSARAVEDDLKAALIERDQEIRSLMIAAVAEEHILLLGDPGTAKSALARLFSHAIGGRYFGLLLDKFTTPEALFGPWSLKGLENDEYRRVCAGYLPDCEVAFLDEVFKGSTAIQNTTLMVLNEREFVNGNVILKVPLKVCVGASNELPAEADNLAAMYDRFMLRHWVSPINSRSEMKDMLSRGREPHITARLSDDDLATLREARNQVVIPDSVMDTVLDLKDELAKAHGVLASDRRWRKCVKLLRASAVLDGRLTAQRRDILILAHALWSDKDGRAAVYGTIAQAINPDLGRALKILDSMIEQRTRLDLSATGSKTDELAKASEQLRQGMQSMAALEQSPEVEAAGKKLQRIANEVAQATARRLGLGNLTP